MHDSLAVSAVLAHADGFVARLCLACQQDVHGAGLVVQLQFVCNGAFRVELYAALSQCVLSPGAWAAREGDV
jgi:hypothetical protein